MIADKKTIGLLFKQYSLYNTTVRSEVMRIMMLSKTMLSLPDILKELKYNHDRVTIYRILRMFCRKQLVFKLVDLQNNAYYRFNSVAASKDLANNAQDKVFFKCTICGCMTIIDHQPASYVLPEGFIKTATNFLIAGYCDHCTGNSSI